MFDHCWSLRKLVWVFEFWNEMLVSNIRCKICWKAWVRERFFTRILKREGWEINDLSPLSWQFFEILRPLGCFQRFRSFETKFSFKKTQISQFWYHEMFIFSESCLSQKTFYCRKLIVFSCLQFADCYIWSRICLVVWFLCFNHCYGIFWKVSLKKSWCCRKHVFVFEIVSLKDLNKFDQIIFFPMTFG